MGLNQSLIYAVRDFVLNDITRVRVNQSVDVNSFVSKTVSFSVAIFEFNIPESIKTISQLEFYNSDGRLRASIGTNVDTTNNTRVKYSIRVRSGNW